MVSAAPLPAIKRPMFSYFFSAFFFIIIAVASLTSTRMFGEIYNTIAEFLSLSNHALSLSMRESSGLGHFVCYAFLSLSLAGVFSQQRKLVAPMVAVVFGMAMEFLQIFIPSRDASVMDVGVNFLGASLGFGVYLLWAWLMGGSHRRTPTTFLRRLS